jgi:vacuolar-type H+-ATPase subunit D/Vma8
METSMADFDKMLKDLKEKRDELRVRIHLASRELQDEWQELEQKMEDFSRRARLKESGAAVSKALGALGTELKSGYQRIHRALKKD